MEGRGECWVSCAWMLPTGSPLDAHEQKPGKPQPTCCIPHRRAAVALQVELQRCHDDMAGQRRRRRQHGPESQDQEGQRAGACIRLWEWEGGVGDLQGT